MVSSYLWYKAEDGKWSDYGGVLMSLDAGNLFESLDHEIIVWCCVDLKFWCCFHMLIDCLYLGFEISGHVGGMVLWGSLLLMQSYANLMHCYPNIGPVGICCWLAVGLLYGIGVFGSSVVRSGERLYGIEGLATIALVW
ncbi:hypothetical protein LOK49_LG11G00343 [Camellia lanceoleosa]|uniref:Uncharacterized protein n=1 Tax=Camellia lanceoleosa TaxID=1840588 RepID=A0ACC0G0W8_9ERIC|nr:hypothetical protein LOK49_LG11G00343 [Camellia lanceoleosa]